MKRQVLSFHGAEICWSCDWPRYTAKTVLSPQNVHRQFSYTPMSRWGHYFPRVYKYYFYLTINDIYIYFFFFKAFFLFGFWLLAFGFWLLRLLASGLYLLHFGANLHALLAFGFWLLRFLASGLYLLHFGAKISAFACHLLQF